MGKCKLGSACKKDGNCCLECDFINNCDIRCVAVYLRNIQESNVTQCKEYTEEVLNYESLESKSRR